MTDRNLAQWLAHLEALHPREIELGLERVTNVAVTMQLLPVSTPVVTVAGTNGKGSTVAVLEALALFAGRRCGVFTSPHFLKYNERVRICGRDADDASLCAAFEEVERGRGEISLSYFEFSFLAALALFKRESADLLVLEVGLGGRLDAVNCVDADVAVITQIALDHQQWLGNTRELIAREKAGVSRPHKPLVLADESPPATLLSYLDAQEVPVLLLNEHFAPLADGGFRLYDKGETTELAMTHAVPGLMPVNIAAALQAFALLDLPLPTVIDGKALLPNGLRGRRQALQCQGHHILLDVAHNPAAVAALSQHLTQTDVPGRTIAVFNAMSDKDIRGMIRACKAQADHWWIVSLPDVPRAATAGDVAQYLREEGESNIHLADTAKAMWPCVMAFLQESDRLVVFGSFYTVAAVLPLLDCDLTVSERPD